MEDSANGERKPSSHSYVIRGALRDGRVKDGYLAISNTSGKTVVIKKLADPTRVTDEQRQFIRTRYQTVRDLTHPGIVPYLDLVELGRGIFLVEEYTGGITLRTLLSEFRARGMGITPSAFVIIGNQLVRALVAAHKHQIIHGRLAPSHVLIDRKRDIRVTDFMFTPPRPAEIAQLGKYAAPELRKEYPVFSRYSDIYSLAVILYELVSVRSKKYPGKAILPLWFRKYRSYLVPALSSTPEKRAKGLAGMLEGLQKIETDRLNRKEIEAFSRSLEVVMEST